MTRADCIEHMSTWADYYELMARGYEAKAAKLDDKFDRLYAQVYAEGCAQFALSYRRYLARLEAP